MLNNNYNLDIKEDLSVNDVLNHKKGTIICGHLDIIDKFGNKILEKDNLVVLQGRGFILKKLFCHPEHDMFEGNKQILGAGNTDIEVTQYTVPILFAVGNKGTEGGLTGAVATPKYDDNSLSYSSINGSIQDVINGAVSGIPFTNIKYVNDIDNNESYVLLELELSLSSQSVSINEAGLLFGEVRYNNDEIDSVSNLKLMSRLTFNTITLSANDKVTIRYYLYA